MRGQKASKRRIPSVVDAFILVWISASATIAISVYLVTPPDIALPDKNWISYVFCGFVITIVLFTLRIFFPTEMIFAWLLTAVSTAILFFMPESWPDLTKYMVIAVSVLLWGSSIIMTIISALWSRIDKMIGPEPRVES